MVKLVERKMFQSESGRLFESPDAALEDEVTYWLRMNDALSESAVKEILQQRNLVRTVLIQAHEAFK